MPTLATIAHNAVIAKLVNPTDAQKLEVQEILTYVVAGSEHSQAFKVGNWDGRASFFDYSAATFPRGFVKFVQAHLQRRGYTVRIARKPLPEPLGPENPKVDDYPEEARYDYQPEVVRRLLAHGQIIAQVATGGGKSRIAKLATARINRPTLFLTTRGVLMYQMARQFQAMGRKVAILGDSKIQVSDDVTCGMVQTIISWLKDPEVSKNADPTTYARQFKRQQQMIKALERFELVILEEAHEVSGNSFYDILQRCKNAHYRIALTATPFMKDDAEDNMRLMASSGHIAIKITEKLLIDRGILAKPYFKFIDVPKPDKLYRSTPWQRAYELGIVEHDRRNVLAIAEIRRAAMYGLTSMALVQRRAHGEALLERMTGAGLRADFINGDSNQDERDAQLARLGRGELDCLIGTNILDVGVDVPAIGLIALLGGGKAEVATRQRIGRGLREKKNGTPNAAFIIDFTDQHNNTLKKHYLQRRSIIEGTEGFGENIVTDFDYRALGFVKK